MNVPPSLARKGVKGLGLVLVYLGIGSNLGDREANIQHALELLGQHPEIQVLRSSTIHETEPVDMEEPDASDFLNAAVEIETGLSPRDLLTALAGIEGTLGRRRSTRTPTGTPKPRYRSRTIDLDILLYEDAHVREEGLEIPHPRMAEREFVLAPLAELCPDRRVPGSKWTVGELRDRLTE